MATTRERLVAMALEHAAAEGEDDPERVFATLEDEPVYELQPMGLAFRGMDAARTYYDHFFTTFRPTVANYQLRGEWVNDVGVAQEYTIWTQAHEGAIVERHDVFAILTFGTSRLSGERVYGSERLLRSMFGPAYDLARAIT